MTPQVMFKRHFQVAYVANDIDSAMNKFGREFGIAKWDVNDMQALLGEQSAAKYIGNAYIGDLMVEVIQPVWEKPSIYSNWHITEGKSVRFHHLGFLADSADEFKAMREQLVRSGYSIDHEDSFGDVLDYMYADTSAELGHWYEVIFLKSGGAEFFSHVPHN